ncbi:HNH endonuclease [Agrobacterium rosae]|uniref:HNH endonuclease signature motif containing protein n=1 Tax=Agrobacterium rosae TaxID=1972867 RepID=UPI0019D404B9|nr:HNH endonuclease signature motif containing protein [Agrobacterium rosae]MBN7804882.1 HNH endonuclease [Agrobacterium rosae]
MTEAKILPEQALLNDLLRYDHLTGVIFWKHRSRELFATTRAYKIWNGKHAGTQAGAPVKGQYIRVAVFGVRYFGHRVIWKMMTGSDPMLIDHINGNGLDNRWANLRDATSQENMRNVNLRSDSTSGVPGVNWYPALSKWHALITVSGKPKHLGYFIDLEEAVRVRKAAERRFGFHPNHGRPAVPREQRKSKPLEQISEALT